jgi:hypothetical protein
MYRHSNIKQGGINKGTKETAQVRKEHPGKQKRNKAKLMKGKDE